MSDNPLISLWKAATGGAAVPTQTIGQTQASAYGGYVQTNERSAKLQGRQRYLTYTDMLANTSIVATGTRYFLNILSNSHWSVEPARDAEGEDLPGAKEIADLVEDMMGDMVSPWSQGIRRAGMYRFFGFSVQEWTAKRRPDGLIGMLDLEARPQVSIERWEMDPHGAILGCYQSLDTGGEVFLPRNKIVHTVDNALNDSPEGLGLFRHLVRSAERLRAFEELEEVAFETDLRGIPIARAPLKLLREMEEKGQMKVSDVNRILRPLNSFIKNHIRSRKSGMLIDSETYVTQDDATRPSAVRKFDVDLLQGSSTSQEAVAAAISRITAEMARTLSIEHLLLGSDGAGSLALGKVKTNDFYMVVSSTQGDVRETLQQDWLEPICRMNGWPEELWPKLKTDSVQFKDVEAMAAVLKDMATAGAVLAPNDPAINEMRDLMGFSRAPEVELDDEDLALTGDKSKEPSEEEPDDVSAGPAKRGETTKKPQARKA